jgi:hypothetical protein
MHDRHLTAMALVTLGVLCAAASLAVAENGTTPTATNQQGGQDSAAPTVAPAVTILNSRDVEGILGRQVRSAADENMGRVVDVLVDGTGQARAAIIDFGGFLGVGSRKIAVDWNALHFSPTAGNADHIALELTRDQVKAAPEYQDGKPVVVLGALGKLEPWLYP